MNDVTWTEKRSVDPCSHEMPPIPNKISKVDNTNKIHLRESYRNPPAVRQLNTSDPYANT